jgi:NAD(P)-dependent dehydrogenase (short-subunit alcohol dehydrogenase family)
VGVRSVVVTGAGSGIGARAVQRLNADGAQVVAADIDPQVAETYAGHAGRADVR